MFIITGSIAYDYIMGFPGSFSDHILPENGKNINISFVADKFARRRGGTAGNVSYTLGLLQTPHLLYSYAGSDFTDYRKDFEKLGIDLSGVRIDESESTALGFAMSDKRQNQIWGFYYGAANKNKTLKLSRVAKKNDLVLIGPQGADASMSLVRQCIDLEIAYMFDPGFILTQVTDKDLEDGLEHASYIIGNSYEIEVMKKRVSRFVVFEKQAVVIETRGKDGAFVNDMGKTHKIKPVRVKAISTVGAGDAWRSGFLAGIQKGFDILTCSEMGSVAGSFAVEKVGTQEHEFSKKEFAKRYKDTYNKELVL